MDVYFKAFQDALNQNEIEQERWISFKNDLSQTRETINTFLQSCKLDILVPLGRKAFVRGKLQHTNDILMSHNSNYFSLMSNSQANEIMELRINASEERLKSIWKERELFTNKLDVNDAFAENEIIEEYNEETEKEWREKHRESIRRQKLKESQERASGKEQPVEINDLLDQYELLEEMTNELESMEIEGASDSSDMIAKLMTGDIKLAEKERKSHDSHQKVEQKRKVRFSSSLEDIKIFDENEARTKNFTIPITFKHSPAKFIEPKYNAETDGEVLHRHPGEIYTKFKEQTSPKTKSILKETNYDPTISVKKETIRDPDNEDDEAHIPLSSFPLICTDDVIERKTNGMNSEFKDFDVKSSKRISKFKEMRSKIKS